jgi:hypothetical protein
MRKLLGVAAGLALLLLSAGAQAQFSGYYGVNLPLRTSNCAEASQLLPCLNRTVLDINTGVNAQTTDSYTRPRNILDNGGMQVQQRGTGVQTCGTTTIPSSAYGPDRWGCNANVTSGAGSLVVDNTTADLPTGPLFFGSVKFYRTSGALAQPQCVMQEIPTSRLVPTQGLPLVLSVYIKGLANMIAESTTVNAYVFYGTGTDQGLQSFTASPAITPAWTGINSSLTTAWTITSAWARYSYTFQMPVTATEAAVALCWTPTTGGTAGATDGFQITGTQLEVASSGIAGSFEFRPYAEDLAAAQRYYWQWAETVSSTADSPFMCAAQSSTVAVCKADAHVAFRVAPTITCTAGTLKRQVAGTDTTVTSCAAAATTNGVAGIDNVTITATVGSGDTAGLAGTLMSGNSTGGGIITASADF